MKNNSPTNPAHLIGLPFSLPTKIVRLPVFRFEGKDKYLSHEVMELLCEPKGIRLETFSMQRGEEKTECYLFRSENLIVIPPDAPWWTVEACEKFAANNCIPDSK